MKKITAIILFVSVILTTTVFAGTQSLAAEENNGIVTASVDEGGVGFDRAYAKVGEKISVCSDTFDVDDVFYKWYIDNKQINNYGKSYTPCEDDLEAMLTVEVFDKDCEFVGRKSMLISTLPVVYVEIDDRKEVKYKTNVRNADIRVQGNDEFNDPAILYEGRTEIKGRGNSTWAADKKPYKLKLDSKTNLFDMGKNKHWVLLSNPFDTSNMRNVLSYNLSGKMGLNYQKSEWVELVLNGRVSGIYQLCEHVRVDKERVNITNWDDIAEDAAKAIYKANNSAMTKDERDELIDFMTDEMSWTTSDSVTFKGVEYTVSDYFEVPDINGGYLLEVDEFETTHNFKTPSGRNVSVSKPEGASTDMINHISGYYNAFETALFSNDFCTQYDGKTMRYTDFIDVESFAKGVLVNEIFENFDFGLNSTFVSKDIDGKLVFGPVWDVDNTTLSSYNVWTTASRTWIKRMLSDPVFMNEVRKIYLEYRYTAINDLIKDGGDFDSYCSKIYTSAVHNDNIWHNEIKFTDNADDLRYRLQLKINWLDKQFFSLDTAVNSVISRQSYKHFITSDSLELSLADDKLSVTCNNSPAEIEIFINGASYRKLKNPEQITEFALPPADSDSVITVIAYDGEHAPICGSFATTERFVESLDVIPTTDKSYSAGDVIDASDFTVTAHYSNGTTAEITPDLIYTYDKNPFGIQYFSYGRVTEAVGDIYAVFMYRNTSEEVRITVNERENSEDVARMIAELPESISDIRAIEMLLQAKLAYTALSSDATSTVDSSRLDSAMEKLDEYSNDKTILGCYADGLLRTNSKNTYKVIVKGSPRSIVFVNVDNSTNTYMRTGSTTLSIKQVGNYEIWSLYRPVSKTDPTYSVRASYPDNRTTEPIIIDNLRFIAEQNPISKIVTDSFAEVGKEHSVRISTSSAVDAIKLVENGVPYSAEISDTTADFKLTLTQPGMHSFKVFCLINGSWLECENVNISAREAVPTDSHIFFAECEERTYSDRAKARVITEKDVEAVSLVSGDDVSELTSTIKNGFKIWSGTFDRSREYNVWVSGVDRGITLSSGILGDVNGDNLISSLDALHILQVAVGKRIPTEEEFARGDIDGNGLNNSHDALLVLQIVTGKLK